jgi:hypothetical protein
VANFLPDNILYDLLAMTNLSLANLPGNSCQFSASQVLLTKKTEVVTSAARLSAPAQILGFAPPPRSGFAISNESIELARIHKIVSQQSIFHFQLPRQRSKIDIGDKLHIVLNFLQTPPIYIAIGIIIYNFRANVNVN